MNEFDRTKGEVWIFAEQHGGELADVPFELLGKGREIADRLGVPLAAVVVGGKVAHTAKALFAHGADKVHVVENPLLEKYQNKSYRHVLVELVKKCRPQVLVFGATAQGRDLAPTVASSLRCGLTADCTDLQIGDYEDAAEKKTYKDLLLQIRPAFGGNIIAQIVNPRNWPQMATVREGVMKALAPVEGRTGETVVHEVSFDGVDLPVEVLEEIRKAKSVNLKGARIIVAGGAGVGSKENFAMLHELASLLGGAVGGSRAAVDLGYVEHERQIGQTGVTVRPALFIAVGISGAIQHVVGMRESAKIIAINSDKDAPIFSVAHYGIVGDLNAVLPKLIKAVRSRAC